MGHLQEGGGNAQAAPLKGKRKWRSLWLGGARVPSCPPLPPSPLCPEPQQPMGAPAWGHSKDGDRPVLIVTLSPPVDLLLQRLFLPFLPVILCHQKLDLDSLVSSIRSRLASSACQEGSRPVSPTARRNLKQSALQN